MKRSNLTRILSALLALALAFALTACAGKTVESAPETAVPASETAAPEPAPEPEPAPDLRDGMVGISMPTKDLQRWFRDGENMKKQMEELGYEVDLQFAANDPSLQISQLENMIAQGAKLIIVSSVDGDALGTVLDQAKEAGCAIIAYDRPIGSDAVSYYTTFDRFSVGAAQARFIVDRLDLANAGDQVYNLEFIGENPDDGDAYIFLAGIMNELEKYIDAGTLNVVSGLNAYESFSIEGLTAEKAQERFENLLSTYYTDKQLDAVLCSNDAAAQGVAVALDNAYKNEVYPIIIGQDCEIGSVKNILDGKQTMSLFKDTRKLAAKAVEMADAIMQGGAVPTNTVFTTVDGAQPYPAFYVDPDICTKDNIVEIMLDSGYYTAEELGLEP